MSSPDVAKLVYGYLTDQGLEKTKHVFFEECADLKCGDLTNWENHGQKLALIIEEYFVLKGHDKRSKRDPESVLLLLWKQFDALVGQLKHSTIHAVKEKTKTSRVIAKQAVRVRELNRRNRASLQRIKPNSVFVPNPDLVKVQNSKDDSADSPQNFPQQGQSVANANVTQGKLDSTLPLSFNCILNTTNTAQSLNTLNDDIQPLAKSGVLERNELCEDSRVLVSAIPNPMSDGELFPSDQFKSPKRKSVKPKRRYVGDVTSNLPVQSSVSPVAITSQEEVQLDLQSLVENILGQPELSEKLAENINRAVEIDISTNHEGLTNITEEVHSVRTQGAMVDSVKVDSIMEMMKTDPAFEHLFSTFETFNNSCEESDFKQSHDEELPGLTNQEQPILQNARSNLATDALLLLASSPARSSTKTVASNSSDPLETPPEERSKQLGKAIVTSSSPFTSIMSNSSCPTVLMSPGRTKTPANRAVQPILSHVRQLDFSSLGCLPESSNSGGKSSDVVKVSNMGNTSDGMNIASRQNVSEVNVSSCFEKGILVKCGRNAVDYKDVTQCREPDVGEECQRKERTSKDSNGNVSSLESEESSLSVLEELATNAFTQLKENTRVKKSGSKKHLILTETADMIVPNNDEGERQCAATNKITLPDLVETEERHKQKTLVPDEVARIQRLSSLDDYCLEDNRTPKDDKSQGLRTDLQSKIERTCEDFNDSSYLPISKDSSGYQGKKAIKEETEEGLRRKVDQKTPVIDTADTTQVPKRKIKKNKKSIGTSKKRKILPVDLDVDKFLSRLHYLEEKM